LTAAVAHCLPHIVAAEADIVEQVVVEREQGPLGAALRRP
jgi:hypothetical protein